MTITVEVPPMLEAPLRAKAAAEGCDLEETVLALLKASLADGTRKMIPNIARLEPGFYPHEELNGEDEPYQAVPLPIAGSVKARIIPAGPLTPPILPAE
jgi:hypothetical protein